jgi:hypothetical protein
MNSNYIIFEFRLLFDEFEEGIKYLSFFFSVDIISGRFLQIMNILYHGY